MNNIMYNHSSTDAFTAFNYKNDTFPTIVGEFWTAKQRQMHSLHYAVSYRASFKPELPDHFIQKYSEPGNIILDPFGGRGTTALQANILERYAYSNDINPMSQRLVYAKTHPVSIQQIEQRLNSIDLQRKTASEEDLSMFYHKDTYTELLNLKQHLKNNRDDVDRFIEMIALSRLHGHSKGFFSVYSFPQISIPKENQRKINVRRSQKPEYRAIAPRIIKKAKTVLKDNWQNIPKYSAHNMLCCHDSRNMHSISSNSVDLIVTSPPFLDTADYIADNWMELWFLGIDNSHVDGKIVQTGDIQEWTDFMYETIREMSRVLKIGGHAIIEVGEVKKGAQIIDLERILVNCINNLKYIEGYGVSIKDIMVHKQDFTKLANCFRVANNQKGTNSHRLVHFVKTSDQLMVSRPSTLN